MKKTFSQASKSLLTIGEDEESKAETDSAYNKTSKRTKSDAADMRNASHNSIKQGADPSSGTSINASFREKLLNRHGLAKVTSLTIPDRLCTT